MLLQKEREQVVEYGLKASEAGLCPGTSGNISVYNAEQGLFAISPSGVDYAETRPEDVVVMDRDANIVEGNRKPSSEWELHSAFYVRRSDVGAVVHTHSMYCTTYAVLRRPIQMVHYAAQAAGVVEIPVAPYCTFGTPELAKVTAETCGEHNAVLLANHGIVVCGADIASAFSLAVNLEYVAELQYRAESVGTPCALTEEELRDVQARFQSYGQKEGPSSY